MNKLCCRLEVLPGIRVIDRINNAHAFGFDGIALPGKIMKSWLGELRECIGDSPLPMTEISLGFEGSLVSPDPRVRSECRNSLLQLFDITADLDAQWVNMPPVLVDDNPCRMTDAGEFPSLAEAQDALLVDQLSDLGDEAAKRNVSLVLEPVNRYE